MARNRRSWSQALREQGGGDGTARHTSERWLEVRKEELDWAEDEVSSMDGVDGVDGEQATSAGTMEEEKPLGKSDVVSNTQKPRS